MNNNNTNRGKMKVSSEAPYPHNEQSQKAIIIVNKTGQPAARRKGTSH